MRAGLQRRCACGATPAPTGECEECQRKRLQRQIGNRQSAIENESPVPPIVHEVLRSPGQPLDAATRAFMEPRFAHDFSQVRVHTTTQAAEAAHELNALAFTVGQHIFFGAPAFQPETIPGRALLAHELTHAVQQGRMFVGLGEPAEVGRSNSTEEHQAKTVGWRVALGGQAGAITTNSRLSSERMTSVQRAERGTYVSTIGKAAYLDAGAAFYRHWGYPNVRRVGSMEDVVSDLVTGQGHIDAFRLVAHGDAGMFELGFLRGIPSSLFTATEAGLRGPAEFRTRIAERRIMDDTTFSAEVNDLFADPIAGPLLVGLANVTPGPVIVWLGVPIPLLNVGPASPIDLFLRAVLEGHFLNELRLPNGAVPHIRNRAVLDRFVQVRRDAYSALIVAQAPAAQQAAVRRNLAALEARVTPALQGRRTLQLPQAEIDTLADPIMDPNRPRLRPDIEREVSESAGGPYVTQLARVRARVDQNTHIEIRGCNVGGQPAFLDALRNHFGEGNRLPSVSAPDLFQYFFQIGDVATFRFNRPAEVQRFGTDFPRIKQMFVRAERVRRREAWPVTNEPDLPNFAARYGLNLNELRQLNPEYMNRNLSEGELVWLVARPPISAGNAGSIEQFCEQVLGKGNQFLWPRIWSYNPQIRTPALTPQDSLWVVPPALRNRVAAADPSQQDLQAALQGGTAFVGFLGGQEKKVLVRLDDPQQAAEFAGWLAAQHFDFQARSAVALERRFRGDFGQAVLGTFVQFLSPSYPEFTVQDTLFPSDPRYGAHIIHRP
jgi:Domain of unknown function (DUF4157)